MTYKNILFDVDNTLIDSATIAANVLHKITANYGYDVSVETARSMVGIPTDKILAKLELGHIAEITADFTTAIGKHKDELQFFDGIPAMLKQLRDAGTTVGIVTSRTAAEVRSDLGAFPEITSSNIIVTADQTTEHKPSGAPLRYAMAEHQLAPADTIYVGDAIYDLKAALDAKIDFATATWGALPTTDFSKATYQPQHPSELLALI
ncbi:HAD family hydrolase [Lactiplantibacillus fabifermentans]|uniref:Phosphoglycolate phosphatase n=2 Tax=Lactiplantibacillus fabifermentans TaxID=483011 RepID=A0A0R2P367_9LACO|nr:HAD-IA family hydrolase [Lactiplantibacillus fabifermentans]ETY72976.1 hypothetical protein LFAB_15225 [Lactiplantibacillus fabifermentans T30PCM01]KRO29306.1 phosphoglycolate phosphatase [Lactiplantibacillus fabifermentans DSM 21115]